MKTIIRFLGIFFIFVISQSFVALSANDIYGIYRNENVQTCDAGASLEETCRNFIAKCRKGSIHSEFPAEFYDVQIKVVKNGKTDAHKKAWKLLNDGRFKK